MGFADELQTSFGAEHPLIIQIMAPHAKALLELERVDEAQEGLDRAFTLGERFGAGVDVMMPLHTGMADVQWRSRPSTPLRTATSACSIAKEVGLPRRSFILSRPCAWTRRMWRHDRICSRRAN